MKKKIEEVSDEEFDFIESSKRHGEITDLLKVIALRLSHNDDKQLLSAIKEHFGKFEALAKTMQNAPKDVNLSKICADILESNDKVVSAIENRMLPHSFDLVKNQYGITLSVIVNYEKATEINRINNES